MVREKNQHVLYIVFNVTLQMFLSKKTRSTNNNEKNTNKYSKLEIDYANN